MTDKPKLPERLLDVLKTTFVVHMRKYHPQSITSQLADEVERLRADCADQRRREQFARTVAEERVGRPLRESRDAWKARAEKTESERDEARAKVKRLRERQKPECCDLCGTLARCSLIGARNVCPECIDHCIDRAAAAESQLEEVREWRSQWNDEQIAAKDNMDIVVVRAYDFREIDRILGASSDGESDEG